MSRQNWNRDELIKVLSLYCQLPFGRMHSRNPAVAALAEAIDRTPSAVALKLVNFASLDPELRGRGVGGMGNTSAADRAVWEEFYGRWDALADNSIVPEQVIIAKATPHKRGASRTAPDGPTEIVREVAQRRGQSFFRASVFAAHDWKCCITGITSEPLLRASHIVPWSRDPALRLDPRNGLCLNALHDAAFDRGLIALSEHFELQISKRLRAEVPEPVYKEMFENCAGKPVSLPERFSPTRDMLEFHRTNIFQQ
ncbi:MAG: HNH endonuclease [Phycisphaerales bacterium]|jgi:hypothetical protein|nr:HNH endonuclease [Phycisphaerales bacterium]